LILKFPKKNRISKKCNKNKDNGLPRVTHLLFVAAFIYASYLCLIQDSLAVFTLASRGLAVSPFLLVSIRRIFMFIHQKTCRFCSRVLLLSRCLMTSRFCMMGGVSSV